MYELLKDIVIPIVVAVATFFGTYFLSPRIKEEFKIRENYIVPFRKWCTNMFGVLLEFEHLYEAIMKSDKYNNANYVIYHTWYVHNSVEEGFKWLGKIKKDDPPISNSFHDLFDQIDSIWHRLGYKYPQIISSSSEFRTTLKCIRREDQDDIAKEIFAIMKSEIKKGKDEKDEKEWGKSFDDMKGYLMQQIP